MTAPSATTLLAIASAVALGAVGLPLWKPLLLAVVLAGALSPINERLTRAVKNRRSLSAALITVGLILVVLGPMSLLGVVLVKQTLHAISFVRRTLEQKGMTGLLAPLPDWLEGGARAELERWSIPQHDLPGQLARWPQARQAFGLAAGMVGSTTHLALMAALMMVALFFLLRDGQMLLGWCEKASTMPPGRLRLILTELRGVSRSVLGAQLGSGLAQAVVSTIGFAIARVPSPLLFGALALAASFIPIGGVAAFVGLPLGGLLWLMGHPGWAIFLVAWTTVLTGLVDNVVRPMLVHGGTHLHGGLVFFALLGGLMTFGPMGLVVGPLALALFQSVSAIQRRDRIVVP